MKNQFLKRTGVLLFSFIILMSLLTVPVMATAPSSPSDGNGEGGSTTNTTSQSSGALEITGYKVVTRDANGKETIPRVINPGTGVNVVMTIMDSRSVTLESFRNTSLGISPKSTLNTASFVAYDRNTPYIVSNVTETTYNGNAAVSYTVDFPLVYTGEGNTFQCELFYTYKDGSDARNIPVETVVRTLNNIKEKSASSSDSSTSAETRGTGFVLQQASYGAQEVTAGKAFTLETTLKATNGSYSVEDTSVTLTLPKEITLADGSSVSYIGTVKPNQSVVAVFNLVSKANAEEGSYTVTINIKGINAKDGTPVEASADITVPVSQPDRFEIANPRLPDYLVVGMDDGSGYASVDLINKGVSSVMNVEVDVQGEGLVAAEGKQFVGTIAAGSQNSVDLNITATQAGSIDGQLIIMYENSRGEVKTLTKDFTVQVEEMGMIDPGTDGMFPEPMPEKPSGMPFWIWLIVGIIVVIAVVVVLIVIIKKKKAKAQAQLDDEFDDDDDFDTPVNTGLHQ